MKDGPQAVGKFILGLAHGQVDRQYDKAILELLYLPANFGQHFKRLSAAALYQAQQFAAQSGRAQESNALKIRLLNLYPETQHAKLLRSK